MGQRRRFSEKQNLLAAVLDVDLPAFFRSYSISG
jgi:hypothetical protein